MYKRSCTFLSCTVKKVREFPVPSRDVTTKLSLGGNNDVITELFLPRRSLGSDSPAGDGKLVNHFVYGIQRILFLETLVGTTSTVFIRKSVTKEQKK
jgi:hypothetical protein